MGDVTSCLKQGFSHNKRSNVGNDTSICAWTSHYDGNLHKDDHIWCAVVHHMPVW